MSLEQAARRIGADRTTTLLRCLGSRATNLNLADVPHVVKHQAKLCILDTLGCILIGAATGSAEGIIAAEQSSDPRRLARVIGTCERLSIEGVARVNGINGNIFELSDLIGGHASISSISLALAMADSAQHPGTLLLRSVIAGIETTAHAHAEYRATPDSYERPGNAYVGFINTLGAGAVAATFLRLNAETTAQALAVAGALAGWCPAEAIFHDGGGIKPMLFGGWAAAVGLMDARYAQHGVSGPMRLLEGELGFLRANARQPQPEAMVNADQWFLASTRRKMHACCGFIHPAIELVAGLRRTHGAEIFHSSKIRVSALPTVNPAINKDQPPVSTNDARFHAQYCIALAAGGVDVILPEHNTRHREFLSASSTAALMSNVRVVSEPRFKHFQESQIEVVRDALVIAHIDDDNPRWSPADTFVNRVMTLENEPDCQWIASEPESGPANVPAARVGLA